MASGVSDLLGIEKEEKRLILTLVIQSVFLGVFFGVFNIIAHSLFLAKFDETIMAKAYIVSGIIGGALTYLYTYFQGKGKFLRFSFFNLLFILLVTIALWALFKVYRQNWVIFFIFLMLGPLNLLALLGFYGTVGRLLTLRQGRRLFSLVDTGLVIGVIISSFAIPGILRMNVATYDILLISAAGLVAALMVQFFIGTQFKLIDKDKEEDPNSESAIKLFRKSSYISTMGIFIALSMVVMFFIQYSFMAVTRARFPGEEGMASFLGLFEGSMMVFTLIIKTFLFSYLIKAHGLKVTLTIGPILIGFFAVIATIIGVVSGVAPGSTGFMIFFLILAMSRLFSKALKDSVETPAFKVLYQTISEKMRFRVQSVIDGTINEIAALTSGLLLTGLGALAFIKLIHFSWFLCGIVLLWVFAGIKLYNEYRESVKRSLDTESDVQGEDEADDAARESGLMQSIDVLMERDDNRGNIKGRDLRIALKSKDMAIRKSAIYSAIDQNSTNLIPEICSCLGYEELTQIAFRALKHFREQSFSALESTFFKASVTVDTRVLIVRLIGISKSDHAADFLMARLWDINRNVKHEALQSLISIGVKPDDDTRQRLHQEVIDIIGLMTWYISALVALERRGDKQLITALEEDYNWWVDYLFSLLSILYDRSTIDKIHENLSEGTVENASIALELLDIVVDESIKPRLSALLDVVSKEDKLKQLFRFYPGAIPMYENIVEDLINRDYNQISVWTKYRAVLSLESLALSEVPDVIKALLFNPNQLLREVAARYLKESGGDAYSEYAGRVPSEYRPMLDRIASGSVDEKELLSTKVEYLSNYLPSIKHDALMAIGERLELCESPTESKMGDILLFSHNYDENRIQLIHDSISQSGGEVYALPLTSLIDVLFQLTHQHNHIVSEIDKNIA